MHHISAVITDSDTYKIVDRIPTSNGSYRATITKNGNVWASGKDFFPDEWSEEQVIGAIKGAYLSKIHRTDLSGNTFVGTASNGIRIRMYINLSTGKIISAFPHVEP